MIAHVTTGRNVAITRHAPASTRSATTRSIRLYASGASSKSRSLGVKHVVVFVNKTDVADSELLELVVLETQDLLVAHGYADSPVIQRLASRC